tara:strand:+ start:89 stop:211 length:123 start_codon:yes stop_codon:yes gene_type:complete
MPIMLTPSKLNKKTDVSKEIEGHHEGKNNQPKKVILKNPN